MQRQQQQRFANAHLADIEEEEENFTLEGLVADTKPIANKGPAKAPGANNRSRKMPP